MTPETAGTEPDMAGASAASPPSGDDPRLAAAAALSAQLATLRHDPWNFVNMAFPWRRPGSPLAGESGPHPWQEAVLREIAAALRANTARGAHDVIQHAIASGHGVGKSALVSWVLLWGLCTAPDTRLTLTANTEQQLRTKTWPELAKWFGMMLYKHDFTFSETAITSRAPGQAKTWRLDRVTWSERNTEAFQGLHNKGRRIVLVFDEASAIADSVWEASEGALTDADTEIVWLVLGNPTRNAGRFRECFGTRQARWTTRQVDSRAVPGTNAALFARWVADYGEDSDFVRVRVKGEFPRAGSSQFIADDVIAAAATRIAESTLYDPVVLGVDVARHGEDMTVIWARRGRDARTYPPVRLRIPDLMQVAARVAEQARVLGADAVFVDMGMGAGVVDRLAQLGVPNVHGIEFGAGPDGIVVDGESAKYANKRAEMWGNMRAWLKHGAIPDDVTIKADLAGPEYGFNARDAIQLERKQDMKRRGLASPDLADALALTFAWPVQRRTLPMPGPQRCMHVTDHDWETED